MNRRRKRPSTRLVATVYAANSLVSSILVITLNFRDCIPGGLCVDLFKEKDPPRKPQSKMNSATFRAPLIEYVACTGGDASLLTKLAVICKYNWLPILYRSYTMLE